MFGVVAVASEEVSGSEQEVAAASLEYSGPVGGVDRLKEGIKVGVSEGCQCLDKRKRQKESLLFKLHSNPRVSSFSAD